MKEWPSGTVKDVPTYELGLDSCSADAGGTSPVCSEITNYQTATRAEYEALCKAEGAVFKTGDCRARHPDLRIRSACLGTGFKIEIKDVKGMAYFYDKGYPDDQARQACLAAGGQFTLPRTY